MTATRTTGAASERKARFSLSAILERHDIVSGASLILIGGFFMWVGRNYAVGTAASMGPGYFPRALCWILIAVGVAILLNGLRNGFPRTEDVEKFRFTPLIIIPAACVIFALTAQSLGLLLSGAILTMIASFAYPGRSIVEAVVLTLALLLLSLGLWWGVGVQLPLLPRFL